MMQQKVLKHLPGINITTGTALSFNTTATKKKERKPIKRIPPRIPKNESTSKI